MTALAKLNDASTKVVDQLNQFSEALAAQEAKGGARKAAA
jgi:hypothetical protein